MSPLRVSLVTVDAATMPMQVDARLWRSGASVVPGAGLDVVNEFPRRDVEYCHNQRRPGENRVSAMGSG